MLHKVIITLVVCAGTVLNVVHSAPNQSQRETSPEGHNVQLLDTNLPSVSLRHSNEPERLAYNGDASHGNRQKRALIFRPLFVYRQQEIKKQKLKEMREQQQQQQ
uniref:Secreted protein n=1 Tax=Anopheles minimus TaxID=112268 RepID=A0A182WQD7_9DIPT